jgi:cobyrinic acid a,c-diamide synthase
MQLNESRAIPGLVIGAPRSGSGKTTIALGLMRALKRQNVTVAPFKNGPDYIDPAFHAVAANAPGRNLDTWAMDRDLIFALLAQTCTGADIAICEGSMGFFDGAGSVGRVGTGASADISALTGWPQLLVLDVSGHAQSAAALAHGFRSFRPELGFAGVVLNRVASARHGALAKAALEQAGIPVLGALPRSDDTVLAERHLGLVQAQEVEGLSGWVDRLADLIERHVDLAAVQAAARTGGQWPAGELKVSPPAQRIAMAQDAAFSFVYPHLFSMWQASGAEILPFSPLADEPPDDRADICWLPGGYPELHAGRLAANNTFKAGMHRFAATRPVHGECGGAMVLGQSLETADGACHGMLGLLSLQTSFAKRKLHLGYRRATVLQDHILGRQGSVLTGHEFHYSTVVSDGDAPLFDATDGHGQALGPMGSRRDLVSASFFHMIDREPAGS